MTNNDKTEYSCNLGGLRAAEMGVKVTKVARYL
jgi:hypothetical protein